jgi:hypothetical protein
VVQSCAEPVVLGWQIHYPGNPWRPMRMKVVGGARGGHSKDEDADGNPDGDGESKG